MEEPAPAAEVAEVQAPEQPQPEAVEAQPEVQAEEPAVAPAPALVDPDNCGKD